MSGGTKGLARTKSEHRINRFKITLNFARRRVSEWESEREEPPSHTYSPLMKPAQHIQFQNRTAQTECHTMRYAINFLNCIPFAIALLVHVACYWFYCRFFSYFLNIGYFLYIFLWSISKSIALRFVFFLFSLVSVLLSFPPSCVIFVVNCREITLDEMK